jgi:CPA2 family monovalent cation:H+ antiporter-2
VLGLGWSVRTALTVAFALAQIGEFSFILATLGLGLGVLPAPAAGAIVTAALLSIAVNPWMKGRIEPDERSLRARPRLWARLTRRTAKVADALAAMLPVAGEQQAPVGFGPAGHTDALSLPPPPVIVSPTWTRCAKPREPARGLRRVTRTRARRLSVVVSVAAADLAAQAVVAARGLDARIPIIVRARYLAEREALLGLGATAVTVDEEAVAGGLSSYLLRMEWAPASPPADAAAADAATASPASPPP